MPESGQDAVPNGARGSPVPPTSDLRAFLIKVAALTLAALVVLYAARVWFGAAERGGKADDIVSWQQAAKHYGEVVTVEGTIVGTRNIGKACFLNFHSDWQRTFTAVIFERSFAAFPPKPEEHYRGKKVRVTGLVREYKGKPEIILASPDQIRIVH